MKKNKLAIIGLGHVGSAVLARAIACQLAPEIVCIDSDEKKSLRRSTRCIAFHPLHLCPGHKNLFRRL